MKTRRRLGSKAAMIGTVRASTLRSMSWMIEQRG
jgi:hypothetical protein